MAARNHTYYCLDGIRDELEAHLATYIGLIETAQTITLPDPDAYVLTSREPEHTGDPVVTVSVEGTVEDAFEWISPYNQVDLRIPLLVRVWHHIRETDQDADICALHYADAVAEVLAGECEYRPGGTPTGIANLLMIRAIQTGVDYTTKGKHGRVSEVRADVTFRTTRAT